MKLMPCSCGKKAFMFEYEREEFGEYQAQCEDPACDMRTRRMNSEHLAIRAWNILAVAEEIVKASRAVVDAHSFLGHLNETASRIPSEEGLCERFQSVRGLNALLDKLKEVE